MPAIELIVMILRRMGDGTEADEPLQAWAASEAASGPQAEACQVHVRRGGQGLGRAVADGVKAEPDQVDALPAHRDLDDPVPLTLPATGVRRR